jgi:hypothetical protein
MDVEVEDDSLKPRKPTPPSASVMPSPVHPPTEVETAGEDEEDDGEDGKERQQPPPAFYKDSRGNCLQTHNIFAEPIITKPARKASSRDGESQEKRTMRLEKDRLRKQKRTREASKTELDDIRAKDVARKKNNGESQEKRTMRLEKDRLRKQKRTREASKTELDDVRAEDAARKRRKVGMQSTAVAAARCEARNQHERRTRAKASDEASHKRHTADNERKSSRRVTETSHEAAHRREADYEGCHRARKQARDAVRSKVVDFSTSKMVPDSNFNAFEQNPEVAAMLWHFNSGFQRFNGIENLTKDDPDLHRKIKGEVLAEKLSNEEKNCLINDYLHAMGRGGYDGAKHEAPSHRPNRFGGPKEGRDAPMLTCGSCGVKEVERGRTQFFEPSLALLDVLALSDLQLQRLAALKALPPLTIVIEEDGATKDVHLSKLLSAHT